MTLPKEIQDAVERHAAMIQREGGFGEIVVRIVDHNNYMVSGRVDEKICLRPAMPIDPLTFSRK